MAITSKDIIERFDRIQCERIYVELLKEAMNGIADLEANKTLSLAQFKARHGRQKKHSVPRIGEHVQTQTSRAGPAEYQCGEAILWSRL